MARIGNKWETDMILLTDRQIVSTPILGKDSLAIALAKPFAEACVAHEVADRQEFMEGVWRLMGNKLPVRPSNFIDFYKGILPRGFYYKPGDGIWLTLDVADLCGKRPLIYHGHNEDRYSGDRLWLIRAFQSWVEGAMHVLDWK